MILAASQESSEESEQDSSSGNLHLVTPVQSWEENWLFQKRKLRVHSEPVSMLVPNPSGEFRALIGDKDAEDISDLSEFSVQSEDEDEDEDEAAENEEFVGAIDRAVLISNLAKNVEKTRDIPKTRASIGRNFKLEKIAQAPDDYDYRQQSREKLVTIDKLIDATAEPAKHKIVMKAATLVTSNQGEHDDAQGRLDNYLSLSALEMSSSRSTMMDEDIELATPPRPGSDT